MITKEQIKTLPDAALFELAKSELEKIVQEKKADLLAMDKEDILQRAANYWHIKAVADSFASIPYDREELEWFAANIHSVIEAEFSEPSVKASEEIAYHRIWRKHMRQELGIRRKRKSTASRTEWIKLQIDVLDENGYIVSSLDDPAPYAEFVTSEICRRWEENDLGQDAMDWFGDWMESATLVPRIDKGICALDFVYTAKPHRNIPGRRRRAVYDWLKAKFRHDGSLLGQIMIAPDGARLHVMRCGYY